MKPKIKSYTLKLICLGFCLIAVSCVAYCFFVQKEANPLKLPENAPEPLVALKGKLIFKLFSGPPEYSSIDEGDRADYCWVLQLDNISLDRALTTPVAEPASSLTDITSRPNHSEVILSLDKDMEIFCHEHVDQQVRVEGHLFHAHTAHHYTPILMDVKKIL
jgi:Domain of unknown function (DUF4431)